LQGIVDEINKKNKKKDSRVFTYVYTVNCEPAFVNHSRVIDTMVVVVKCVPINVYAWIYHLAKLEMYLGSSILSMICNIISQ